MAEITHGNPPFRAEHVGSLLRPRTLKQAAKGFKRGELQRDDYLEVLEREIARVVQLQEDVGLKSITDGEFGRSSWFGFFFERLEGFELRKSRFRFHDEEGDDHEWMTGFTNAPMRRTGPIATEEFQRLRSHTRHTPKANLPSPSALHFFRGDDCRDPGVYPDLEQWWDEIIAIYQAEIRALSDCGCTYLQLDEVPVAMLCDPDVREQVRGMGLEPDAVLDRYLGVINRVLEARPEGMTVAMHLCRGNFRSRWLAEGGYGPVAERLFNEADIDAFFLEYDTERAGDFTPLQAVPEHKTIVLGLVSSKTPVLESEDELARRIDAATAHVPLERLALSPQCGFASVAGGNPLSEEEQMRKLDLVVRVAERVWGDI